MTATLAELSAQAAASASTSSPTAGPSTTFTTLPTQASIAEDAIEYVLWLPDTDDDDTTDEVWAALILAYIDSLLPRGWIWHKDGFEVRRSSSSRRLEGTSRVGDSIDDEYLILHLLMRISLNWPELVIAARDNDGEFMLVEAAAELPKWLEPEVAENRLWIRGGKLCVVPLAVKTPGSEVLLSEDDAVKAVRAGVRDVEASQAVQRVIDARLQPYTRGSDFSGHHHTSLVWLTCKVARALAANPQLAQRAAEAFYTRDPQQIRDAARSSTFSPTTSTADGDRASVLVPLTLTRTAYAQLRGQPFRPPKKFPAEWRDESSETESARRELGAKIITGFEIMYREDPKRRAASRKQVGGKEYDEYLKGLIRVGFFQGELEGSREWQLKEEQARRAWLEATEASTRTSFADAVDAALAANVPPLSIPSDFQESSEDWLHVSPDELDRLLRPRDGDDEARIEDVQELSEMAKRVEQFVQGQGDLEGAQFEDEMSDDDDSDSDSHASMSPSARERRLRELVPGLEPGEWGAKSTNMEPVVATRPPVLEPETYDGHEIDSDGEQQIPAEQGDGAAIIDQDDFIRFARDALGIDDDAWQKLVAERSARGAYVPAPTSAKEATPTRQSLDSFDAVMDAMDAELKRAKNSAAPASDRLASALDGLDTSKLPKDVDDLDGMDDDALEAMDRELRRALGDEDDGDVDDDEEMRAALGSLDDDGKREYRMMRDFLASYQGQAGGAGAVGNLFGRLKENK